MSKNVFAISKASLLRAFLLIIILPIVILSVFVNKSTQNEIKDNHRLSTQGQVLQIDSYFSMYLNSINQDSKFLASNEYVMQAEDSISRYMNSQKNFEGRIVMTPSLNGDIEKRIFNVFESYAKSHEDVVCVYMGTEEGGFVQWPESSLTRRYDPRVRDWYQEILNNKDYVVVTSPYSPIATDDLAVITTGHVIHNEKGKTIGIQALDISLEGLTEIVKNIRLGNTGFLILADAEGTILAHPKRPDLLFKNIKDTDCEPLKQVMEEDSANFEAVIDDKAYYGELYTSPVLGWKYIAMIENGELMASVNKIKEIIAILAILLIILFALIAYVYSDKFSTPLISAAKELKRIEAGDYTGEISLDLIERDDDLGTFIKSVSTMQQMIKELSERIEGTAEVGEETDFIASHASMTLERFVRMVESEVKYTEKIEKTLEKTKVSLKQAQNIVEIWSWELDVATNHITISDEMCRVLELETSRRNYKLEEFMELVHSDDRLYFLAALDRMIYGENICIEFRYRSESGKEVWVYQIGDVDYDAEGDPMSLQSMNHNITDRKITMQRLQEMNNNLREMVKEEVKTNRSKDAVIVYQSRLAKMGQMIGYITHQWKQPLNNLNLIMANLKESSDYGELTAFELEESVSNSKKIVAQMAHTIDDFRYFFKPNRERELFSINTTVSFALDLIEESIKLHTIQIESDLKCDKDVFGYSNELSQVVFNILDNAKDALMLNDVMNRKLEIKTSVENDRAVMELYNNGGHIDEENLKSIFEPYYTTKDDINGTGIGLYMSQMIIENHLNGIIECSNFKEGVLFRIEIPIGGVA